MKYLLLAPEHSRNRVKATPPPAPSVSKTLSDDERQQVVNKYYLSVSDVLPQWWQRLTAIGINKRSLYLIFSLMREDERQELPVDKAMAVFAGNKGMSQPAMLLMRKHAAIIDNLIGRAEQAAAEGRSFKIAPEQTHFPAKARGKTFYVVDKAKPKPKQEKKEVQEPACISFTPDMRDSLKRIFRDANITVGDIHKFLRENSDTYPCLPTVQKWFNQDSGTCKIRKILLAQFLTAAIGYLEELRDSDVTNQTIPSGCPPRPLPALMSQRL